MKMILAFVGIFVAVFTRTFLAYRYKLIRALIHGEDVCWNHKYLASSLFVLVYGFLSTIIIIPAVTLPDDPFPSNVCVPNIVLLWMRNKRRLEQDLHRLDQILEDDNAKTLGYTVYFARARNPHWFPR